MRNPNAKKTSTAKRRSKTNLKPHLRGRKRAKVPQVQKSASASAKKSVSRGTPMEAPGKAVSSSRNKGQRGRLMSGRGKPVSRPATPATPTPARRYASATGRSTVSRSTKAPSTTIKRDVPSGPRRTAKGTRRSKLYRDSR